MSTDYKRVSEALQSGADPAMICMTCPWDRFCITPPTMTSDEVQRKLDEAMAKDEEKAHQARAEGKDPGMPAGMLITTLALAGRDTSASICPVFALRLRSTDGRQIVDDLKASMQAGESA